MAVLALMYHRTPVEDSGSEYDVALSAFRDQINFLLDQGYPFIRFSDVFEMKSLESDLNITITFDDGHKSNLDAYEFLHAKGIVPASFIVSNWALNDQEFLSPKSIAELSSYCEFGGHGKTHTSLTTLSAQALKNELNFSRTFLEQILNRPITAMALPGGNGNPNVIAACKQSGFRLIGNSVPMLNFHQGASVNRICIRNGDGIAGVEKIVTRGKLSWMLKRARIGSVDAAVRMLGPRGYSVLSTKLKSNRWISGS